ncbi:hypothetical protein FHG87_002890 [Trinorchestia longiramus]|nr:hypothetical protein FHG87_002890 [Trinorchestia longiramus]
MEHQIHYTGAMEVRCQFCGASKPRSPSSSWTTVLSTPWTTVLLTPGNHPPQAHKNRPFQASGKVPHPLSGNYLLKALEINLKKLLEVSPSHQVKINSFKPLEICYSMTWKSAPSIIWKLVSCIT